MPILPAPLRAYIGLVATAVETTQTLIKRAPELPVEAVGNTMQLSMKVQQRYQELVARGDELLSHLISPPADAPSWATFDEDDSAADVADQRGAAYAGEDGFAGVAADEPTAAVFDDEPTAGAVFDDEPAAAAVFDDEPAADAVFDRTPTVTHGDPLLAEDARDGSAGEEARPAQPGASRRRVATAPAGPPAPADDVDGTGEASPAAGAVPAEPTPVDVPGADRPELQVPPPAAPPARRTRRPRATSAAGPTQPSPDNPAVQQPAEPAVSTTESDPSSL